MLIYKKKLFIFYERSYLKLCSIQNFTNEQSTNNSDINHGNNHTTKHATNGNIIKRTENDSRCQIRVVFGNIQSERQPYAYIFGRIGHTGGSNMCDSYYQPWERMGRYCQRWRSLQIRREHRATKLQETVKLKYLYSKNLFNTDTE